MLSGSCSLAGAATFNVNSTVDAVDAVPGDGICATAGGQCTLRAAVQEANALAGVDTINVPAGTYTLTIAGTGEDSAATGDIDITEQVTIQGTDPAPTIVDGNALDRVFENYAPTATISGLMVRNGRTLNDGGGIRVHGANTITIVDLTIANSTADNGLGGGLSASSGTVTLINVTLSGNSAKRGGGIHSLSGGITATNVTITANSVTESASGIRPGSGSMVFTNTIVAANSGAPNCDSGVGPGSNNLDDDGSCGFTLTAAPLLGPLQDNGGASWTHAPLIGSPIIEGGTNTGCPATDQRGVPRPDGLVCDIGAFEGVVYEISGRVFEDANFAGTASGFDGGAGDLALANVDVEIYTSADAYITSIVTDGTGSYSFYGIDGDYKIRARTATIGDSNTPPRGTFNAACAITDPVSGAACAVAEQTWANGAAAYGGQSATADDTATDNDAGPGDTWVALTVSGADVPGVDFGFAYNLVVNTAETGQGSLAAFIDNANAIGAAGGTTANYSEFRIPASDPGYSAGTGVFTLAPAGPLPVISDASTTIDGTTQTDNGGNTNTAVHGAGGTVGVDDLPLSQVNGPEVEIQGAATITAGLRVAADNTIIRGMAIYGFGNDNGEGDIVVDDGVSGGTFEFNVLGARAHLFADPGAGSRSRAGFASNGGDGWLLQKNVIGFGTTRGAFVRVTSQNWTIQDNEFRDNSLEDLDGDNIAVDDSSAPGTVTGNLIAGAASQGLVYTATAGGIVENNTFTDNGVGHVSAAPTQSGALTTRSSASGITVDRNVFTANYGPGVMINSGSTGNTFTQNSFFDNGTIVSRNGSPPTGQIGIDLQLASDDQNLGTLPFYNLNDDGDADTGGNDIFNFAVIEQAQVIGADLVVNGFAASGATVEFFISDGDPSNFGEGKDYLFTETEGGAGDADATSGSYGPGPVNGVAQGDENPVPRFLFTIPTASLPVPVTAADTLVATATLGGQTSEFSARAPLAVGNITGTVFVDIAGDGLADGPIGPVPNPFVSGTRVELWLDGGDNTPDGGDDSYYGFTTTVPADGSFQFGGLTNGTYWVTVDSGGVARGPYNGGYSGADAWAEQTYGPAGAATYDGVSWSFAPAAGAVYGGARWDQSDQFPPTNSLPTAEHIARVSVSDDTTTDVDFGFSFNVVTTTRGGDGTVDPGTPPGQRSVQGSLRQFLTNANAEVGANTMRFVPAAPTNASDGGGNDWWQINVSSGLPQVTDVTTVIDGAAYDSSDGVTARNTNSALIGAGAAVGVSGTFNTPQLDPELELRGDTVVGYGLDLRSSADGSAVRNLAVNGFSLFAIGVVGALPDDLDSVTVEDNVLGTSPASFTDDPLLSTGRGLFGRDLSNAVIRNNLVGWVDWGLQVQFDTFDSVIETNEVRGIDTYGIYLGGVAGTGQQPARNIVRGNLVESSGSIGINTFEVQGEITLTENTIRLTAGDGASIYGAQNTITLNVIQDNTGTGLVLAGNGGPATASQVFISQNAFGDNGQLAIDLVENGTNPDGPTLNDDGDPDTGANTLLNFAVIETAYLAGPDLIVAGWAPAGASIEFYLRDTSAPAYGEGTQYLFTETEAGAGDLDGGTGSYGPGPVNGLPQGTESNAERFEFKVPVGGLPAPVMLGDELTATATVGAGLTRTTSEFGGAAQVVTDLQIAKRAFLPDGTPIPSGQTVPRGVQFQYLLYVNNPNAARTDVSVQDILDPAFAYVPGSIRFDNSVPACTDDPCTPAEEATILAAATAGTAGTDAVDGDIVSYTAAGTTIDAGDEVRANARLDILGDRVWAIVFSVKMQ